MFLTRQKSTTKKGERKQMYRPVSVVKSPAKISEFIVSGFTFHV
jgi:hypothetical protein